MNIYSLGDYEKRVLIELDTVLTKNACDELNSTWEQVRNTIKECYDARTPMSVCCTAVKLLLLKPNTRLIE